VQQGGTPVQTKLTLGAVDTPQEREADEVSRQVTRGEMGPQAGEEGEGAVQRRQDLAASPSVVRRAPLRYNSAEVKITPPKKPFSLKDAKDLVDQSKTATPPDLTGGTVKGATAGSDEEIFLWHILATHGTHDNWGTETDIIAPIGWPATAGGAAPVGKVTVTIDDKGNGVAELLSAGGVTAPGTYATAADAEKELQKTYGIANVKNGDTTWSPDDLNKVIGAFALLPTADRAALAGVDLLRVKSLGGTTAGEFESSETASGTAVTVEATLKLADLAFKADPVSFVGNAAAASPASYQTIVHEVGHAIATKARRDAGAAEMRSIAATNQLVADHLASLGETKSARGEFDSAAIAFNAAKGDDRTAAKKVVDEKKKALDAATKDEAAKKKAVEAGKKTDAEKGTAKAATMMPAAVLASFKTDAETKQKASAKAFQTAKKAADGFSPDDQTASESYRQAVEAVETSIGDLMTAAGNLDTALDPLTDTAQANAETRKQERAALTAAAAGNPALTAFAPVETAQDAALAAVLLFAYGTRRTARVHAFVTFVGSKKIKPLTKYAQENWPHKPEEFYAEVYGLWRTDPTFLKSNYPDLFTWFEGGKYK
jgi:hypothetical protein